MNVREILRLLGLRTRNNRLDFIGELRCDLHRVPKQGCHLTHGQILTDFQFFHRRKEKEISNKIHVIFPTTP